MSKAKRLSGLATIGYEGVSLAAFLGALKAAGVTLLLDVRELPISRRKGFSKTPLSEALSRIGIDYRHERALGAPRTVRHRLREDRDLKRYFADFGKYLATQEELLDQLAQTLTGCVALLCFERNPAECHRSVVAAALAKRLKIDFLHLSVSQEDAQQKPAHPRASQIVLDLDEPRTLGRAHRRRHALSQPLDAFTRRDCFTHVSATRD